LLNILPDKEELSTGVVNQFRLQRHPAVVAEYFIKTTSCALVNDHCAGMESNDAVAKTDCVPFRIIRVVWKINGQGTSNIWIL
jgi:hypothetical protein